MTRSRVGPDYPGRAKESEGGRRAMEQLQADLLLGLPWKFRMKALPAPTGRYSVELQLVTAGRTPFNVTEKVAGSAWLSEYREKIACTATIADFMCEVGEKTRNPTTHSMEFLTTTSGRAVISWKVTAGTTPYLHAWPLRSDVVGTTPAGG